MDIFQERKEHFLLSILETNPEMNMSAMNKEPKNPALKKPPKKYRAFVERYPELGEAWDLMHRAEEKAGPLDERTRRLIKLAVSIGAGREGSVHASARKALSMGILPEEIEQTVAVCSSVMGMPGTVAAFTWVRDVLDAE